MGIKNGQNLVGKRHKFLGIRILVHGGGFHQDEIVLLMALMNQQALNPWLEAMHAQRAQVRGVYSLSVVNGLTEALLGSGAQSALLVTLNRPLLANALNTQMGIELRDLWVGLTREPGEVRCVVMTACFCASD